MGQPIAVAEKPSTTAGIVRYELNRNLTGMGHERYRNGDEILGHRPPDELARRLFATGKVDAVHMYTSMITVDLHKGFSPDGLSDVIAGLYTYWVPGREPKKFDAPAETPSAAPAAAPSGGDGESALSEAAKRVPAHLLERSRAAKERWNAKQAEG
ncbi:MAG: hypothetical protein AB7L13_11180 [Acidimicrobiia bacterium]